MVAAIKSKYFLLLVVLIFIAAIVLPLLFLIFNSFFIEGEFFVDNLLSLFQSDVLKSILNSILISFTVGIVSVVAGCYFAFLIVKTNLPLKNIFRFLLVLPLLLPSYITTVAWTDVALFIDIPKYIIYSLPTVVIILSTIYIPLATFIIVGSLQNIAASIEEAGEMMTNYKTVFQKIILPLIRPALFSSFILVFILSISEFAVPSYLSVNVFTTEIFTQFSAFYNYSLAIIHALVLTFICFLLIFPEKHYLSQAPFISFGNKSFRTKTISLRNNLNHLLLSSLYIIFFVLLPILILFIPLIKGDGVSLISIIKQLMPAFGDTLLLSFSGAMLVTFFGFVFALLNNKIFDYLILFVFAIPAIVTGMALTRFYNTPSLNFIYGSSLIVLIVYVARYVFISEKIIGNSLRQIPPAYVEAASIMGASSFYSFKKIILPIIAEALFISFFIALIFCIGELTSVIMIYPPGISLLPVRIFTLMANAPQSTISGMCIASLLFTLLIIALMFGTKKIFFNQSWVKTQS